MVTPCLCLPVRRRRDFEFFRGNEESSGIISICHLHLPRRGIISISINATTRSLLRVANNNSRLSFNKRLETIVVACCRLSFKVTTVQQIQKK